MRAHWWWGRWDLNPGPPAPQAGILDHSSQRWPEITTYWKLDDDPTTLPSGYVYWGFLKSLLFSGFMWSAQIEVLRDEHG